MADTVNARASEILAAVDDALSEAGGSPGRRFVAFGDVAWDSCCDGLLYVRLLRTFATDIFPGEQVTPTVCTTQLAAEFEVTVVRCAPQAQNTPRGPVFPTDDEISEAARLSNLDAETMLRALQQLAVDWWDGPDSLNAVVGSWFPIGPQGDCQAGSITVIVEL